jgi:hypothetical protein
MSAYTYIAVSGQNTIGLNATTNTLTVAAGNGLAITTNTSSNTLTFNISPTISIANLSVTNTLNINPSTTGTLDNITIGATTPKAGTFSSLITTNSVNLSPANAQVTISPTGTGQLVIAPANGGTLDNVIIGSITPAAGTFTNVALSSTQQFASNSAVTKNFATALAAAYGIAMA